jgi:hypothetical protein
MTDSLKRTIYGFISPNQSKSRSLPELIDHIGEKLNYYENQIDFNDFDPNLSFKIDKIITLIESRKSAEHVRHFDDP